MEDALAKSQTINQELASTNKEQASVIKELSSTNKEQASSIKEQTSIIKEQASVNKEQASSIKEQTRIIKEQEQKLFWGGVIAKEGKSALTKVKQEQVEAKSAHEQERECPVCMERCDGVLKCGHLICSVCVKGVEVCPECRAPLDAGSFVKLYGLD